MERVVMIFFFLPKRDLIGGKKIIASSKSNVLSLCLIVY